MRGISGIKVAITLGVIVFVVRWVMLINLLINRNPAEEDFLIQPPETLNIEETNEQQNEIIVTPTQTWTAETWNNSEVLEVKTLDIAIPFRMVSPGLVEFANKYEEEYPGTKVNFITGHESQEFYKNTRQGFIDKEIDIVLVPSTYAVSFKKYAFDMQTKQAIRWFFHNSFQDFFEEDSVNYIPFAIDPFGILSNESLTKTTDYNNILDLYQQYGDTFAFWFDSPSITLLKQWQQPYPGYFQSLYWLIDDRYNTNDPLQFKRFIDRQSQRSIVDRRRNTLLEQRKNENCENYSHICLLGNKKIDAVPWFLWDIILRDREFRETSLTTDQVTLWRFPVSKPLVKWWWRVINSETPELIESVFFMGTYIAEWINWNVRLLPNKMLSAFKNTLDIQLSQPIYKNHKWYRDNAELMYGSLDWQGLFMTRTSIADVLNWIYNIELFMSKPWWEF